MPKLPKLPALVCTALVSTVVIGCSATVSGRAVLGEHPAEATESPALPAAFPPISTYTEGDRDTYFVRNRPRVQGFLFSTPDGLICGNNAYPDAQYEQLSCWGPRPDKGPGDWSVEVDAQSGEPAIVVQFIPTPEFTGPSKPLPPVLKPRHKVTASKGVSECGVDDNGTTACHLGEHGFILTPTSTTLF